jgi:hypothetical protein
VTKQIFIWSLRGPITPRVFDDTAPEGVGYAVVHS